MDFKTKAFRFHNGYIMPLSIIHKLREPNIELEEDDADCYKVVFLDKGEHTLTIDGSELFLSNSHILLLNEKHCITHCTTTGNDFFVLYFDPVVINSHLTIECCNLPNTLSVTDTQDLFFLSIFQTQKERCNTLLLNELNARNIKNKFSMMEYFLTKQETFFWPCQTRGTLLEMLFSLSKPSTSTLNALLVSTDAICSPLVVKVLYYLQAHYTEKITIELLTKLFKTNRTTLLKEFKDATNHSLNEHLIHLRLTIASTLLRSTQLPISEVCERAGFTNTSYFIKSFKKNYDYTPADYRKHLA